MLKTYLNRNLVFVDPAVKTRDELFSFFAAKAFEKGLIEDERVFLEGMKEREDKGSTILSESIALPHARHSVVKKQFAGIVVFSKGFAYTGGILGEKIHLAIFIGSPENVPSYLALLADISRLLKKDAFRKSLLKSTVTEDVLDIVSKHSIQEIAAETRKKKQYQLHLILQKEIDGEVLTSILLEAGIRNITEISSENLFAGSFLKIPFIGSLTGGINTDTNSRTILGITDNKDAASHIYGLLKSEGCDLESPGAGVLYLTECAECYGGISEDIEF